MKLKNNAFKDSSRHSFFNEVEKHSLVKAQLKGLYTSH